MTRELIAVTSFLTEIGIQYHTPKVYCDNKAAITVVNSQKELDAPKDMDLKQLKLRQHYKDGKLQIEYVKSTDNTSDIMTKNLNPLLYNKHRDSVLGHR